METHKFPGQIPRGLFLRILNRLLSKTHTRCQDKQRPCTRARRELLSHLKPTHILPALLTKRDCTVIPVTRRFSQSPLIPPPGMSLIKPGYCGSNVL